MKIYNVHRLKLLIAVLTSLLALATFVPVWGQQAATATIEGIVTDQNSGVVVGAKVTAKNTQTGFTRDIQTDASGVYRLSLLPPGIYDLTINAPNFAEGKRSNLQLTVGQKLNLDVTLGLTATTESVTVTEQAPIVETTR